jgi:hypothetical protein
MELQGTYTDMWKFSFTSDISRQRNVKEHSDLEPPGDWLFPSH